MSALINKFPAFDALEIETELLFQFNKYRALNPLKKGDNIFGLTFTNDFSAWQQFVNGNENHNYVSGRKLSSKPLVVAFFSPQWNEAGIALLETLNRLNAEIKAHGGNLVVITCKRTPELAKVAWDLNLTLNFYFDPTHKLAAQFGVYDKNSPTWERFSGIDVHIPLLAVFLADTYGKVTFDYTNWATEKPIDAAELLSEVYQAAAYINNRQSA